MRIRNVIIRLIGARDPNCPTEDQVLAYSENRLSAGSRAQLELHFADCSDCLEVLAFLGREARETVAPSTEETVSEQTARVLSYIQNDDRRPTQPKKKVRPAGGFYFSYPKLATTVALPIITIAMTIVLVLTSGQSPSDAGMEALRLAVKNERYSEARIS